MADPGFEPTFQDPCSFHWFFALCAIFPEEKNSIEMWQSIGKNCSVQLLDAMYSGDKKSLVCFLPNCFGSQAVPQAGLVLSSPKVQSEGRAWKGSSPSCDGQGGSTRVPKTHGLQCCFQEEHADLSHLGVNMCFISIEADPSNELFQRYKLDQSVCLWRSTPSWRILVVLGSTSKWP